jgi:hypothetical protein
MPVKYGELMKPWKVQIQMKNSESGDDGKWKPWSNTNAISYKYTYANKSKNINVVEREPSRRFIIQDPHEYNGQLGGFNTDLWSNVEEVYIVNGFVNKGDANFEQPFMYKTLEEYGITLGSYPESDKDCMRLKNAGVTAVLDIQSWYRSVEFGVEQQMFRRAGINTVKNIPVRDSEEEEYCSDLFKAVVELDNLINKQGQHVFVHCFTGISRSPTLIILYWAMFLRHQDWDDVALLQKYLMSVYDLSHPNLEVIEQIIRLNSNFQNEQKIRNQEEDEARRNAIMKKDRSDQIKELRDECERLKRKRLAEAEAEKSRL